MYPQRVPEELMATFKERAGWWRVTDWYDEPISGERLPITRTAVIVVGNDRSVCITRTRLIAALETSRPRSEIFSRTLWVHDHDEESTVADARMYVRLDPEAAREVRSQGRMPHVDLWGTQEYSLLVDHVLEQLRADSGATMVQDGSESIVRSARFGVEARIGRGGELVGARLELSQGDISRWEFAGVAVPTFFPARYPSEMRVYQERVRGVVVAQDTPSEIALLTAPRPASANELKKLDIDSNGMSLSIVGLPREDSMVGGKLTGLFPAVRWLAWFGGAVLIVLAAFFAWLWVFRRKS